MRYLIWLALLAPIALNAASIHKSVDADGNIHYGDTPPAKAKTENVRVQSLPSNPGRALPRLNTQAPAEEGAEQDTATEPEAARSSNSSEEIACTNATQDLRVIKRSNRIKLRNSDGTTRYMTAEEIEQRKSQAEIDIAQYCK